MYLHSQRTTNVGTHSYYSDHQCASAAQRQQITASPSDSMTRDWPVFASGTQCARLPPFAWLVSNGRRLEQRRWILMAEMAGNADLRSGGGGCGWRIRCWCKGPRVNIEPTFGGQSQVWSSPSLHLASSSSTSNSNNSTLQPLPPNDKLVDTKR